MFSRSDKSDETTDEFVEVERKERSPILLAALAGLLAIAGAFLLIRYLSDTETATAPVAVDDNSAEVLVVTQPIDAGTDVSEILESPTSYLTARAVPEDFVADTAIRSIAELRDFEHMILSSDALPGDWLLTGRLVERGDFSGDGLIERSTKANIPEGHHTVVVSLPTERALGGVIGFEEQVSVVSTFRVDTEDGESADISVVVLPAVEVISTTTTAVSVGQISQDADTLGTATIGDVFVTLAVEPQELTDLAFAMKYGDILLAGAVEGASADDSRPISSIASIIEGAEFASVSDLEELLGLGAASDEDIEGIETGADDDAAATGGEGESGFDPATDPDAVGDSDAEGDAESSEN